MRGCRGLRGVLGGALGGVLGVALAALTGCADGAEPIAESAPTPDAVVEPLPDAYVRPSAPDAAIADASGALHDAAAPLDATPDQGHPPRDAAVGPTPEACAPLDVCGLSCADLDNDPQNCGVCGRTCVMPNALAACEGGMCAVGACLAGFFDADGDPDNGCELESDCIPGEVCPADCGSMGAVACVEGEGVCQPPPEACTAADDDCDGQCDEGPLPGCRRPIHRGVGNGHIFTDDLNQAQSAPYRLESAGFFHLYTEQRPMTRAVQLCRKPDGKYFLTNDNACEIGRAPDRVIGYWASRPVCGSTPLYRMYHPEQNNHFYTISAPERDNAINNLGFRDEGTVGHVWRGP